jgi:hypothetical protein
VHTFVQPHCYSYQFERARHVMCFCVSFSNHRHHNVEAVPRYKPQWHPSSVYCVESCATIYAQSTVRLAATTLNRSSAPREADVRNLTLDRDLRSAVLCQDKCKLLPDFGPGDAPYADRPTYTVASLPAAITHCSSSSSSSSSSSTSSSEDTTATAADADGSGSGSGTSSGEQPQLRRLVCIQTCQGDKRASGSKFMSFALMQRSAVLLCIDGRAKEPPQWVIKAGFTCMTDVKVRSTPTHAYHYYCWRTMVHMAQQRSNFIRGSMTNNLAHRQRQSTVLAQRGALSLVFAY